MKKLLSISMVALLGLTLATSVHANTSTLGIPGPAGRPQSDTITAARGEVRLERGVGDFSLGVNYPSVASATCTVVNLTSVAGLSPSATIPYVGAFRVFVTNVGPTTAVFFPSMSQTAIAGTACSQTAGILLLTNTSADLVVQGRDGANIQAHGLTAAASLNIGVANY